MLSGSVRNAADARRAQDIANIFANGGANSGSRVAGLVVDQRRRRRRQQRHQRQHRRRPAARRRPRKVINLLTIEGEDQVHLKVTVAEVQRNIAKQLGIEMSGNISIGKFSTCAITGSCSTTGNPFGVNGSALSDNALSIGYNDGISSLSATLRALEQTGMIRRSPSRR